MYHLIHKFNLFDDTHVRHLSETLYSEVRVVDKEIQENISTALYVNAIFFKQHNFNTVGSNYGKKSFFLV
jgi:hypothetical protein